MSISEYRVIIRYADGVTGRTRPTGDEPIARETAAMYRRDIGVYGAGTVELEGRGPGGDWRAIG